LGDFGGCLFWKFQIFGEIFVGKNEIFILGDFGGYQIGHFLDIFMVRVYGLYPKITRTFYLHNIMWVIWYYLHFLAILSSGKIIYYPNFLFAYYDINGHFCRFGDFLRVFIFMQRNFERLPELFYYHVSSHKTAYLEKSRKKWIYAVKKSRRHLDILC
jgi:hypothetical protein